MAEKTATFGIKVRAESDAGLAKASVEQLGKAVEASQQAVKSYGATLRSLRGTSEEVAEAKKRLKAAIADERDRVSQATLALGKHGKSLADVTAKAKDQKPAVARLRDEYKGLRERLDQMGWLAVAAGVAYVTTKIIEGGVAIGRYILESANLLRTQNLLREAATGSASNAAALGHQIDALADKVPTARDELQKLALETSRAFVGTRVSGKGLVDVMGAVAQASAAGMGEAASSFKEIAGRGARTGFTGLNPLETQGKGFSFQDVAGQLSASLGQPLTKVNQLLLYGRVRVDDMAAALRKVAENKWADINRRQMLDLNVQWQKLKDNLVRLTSSVNLEPILKAVARLGKLFSDDTVNGVALRELFKGFGVIMGAAFAKGGLTAEKFIKQVTIAALKLEIEILENRKAIGEWVDTWQQRLPSAETAITAVKVAVVALTGVLGAMAVGAAIAFAPFVLAGAIAAEFYLIVKGLKEIDWDFLGHAIAKGLENAWSAVKGAAGRLASAVKDEFKNLLGIHSPSRVFQEYGRQTAAGYEKGLEGASAGPQKAVGELARPKSIGGGAGLRSSVSLAGGVHINLHLPNVRSGDDVRAAISGPGFRAQLTQAIEDVLSGAGIPTQQPAGAT